MPVELSNCQKKAGGEASPYGFKYLDCIDFSLLQSGLFAARPYELQVGIEGWRMEAVSGVADVVSGAT
jgi:hypothetical protein